VKAGEPILQLYSLDRLEAEAMVESQYKPYLKVGQKVVLEPQHEQGPDRRLQGHFGEITCVAITKDLPHPLFVSGSEDKTVRIWDRRYQGSQWMLKHSDAVRVVVCSPPGAKHNYCLVGCADGSIYLWDLSLKGGSTKPKNLAILKEAHRDGVTSLAFNPDGRFFASGGADNQILMWEVGEEPAKLYAFDLEHGAEHPHQGAVTSLHFTPQGKLVSASRDNTLRVWTLYKDGVKPHGDPIANRSGTVQSLGVSKDGRWMLFDQGKTLQMLAVSDGQTVNTLQNPGTGFPFETVAVFSPDASMILTGGAAEGRLQLWRGPTENQRGYEVRQFTTVEKHPVTCAAFPPHPAQGKEMAYAVSGAKDGSVYIWELPSAQDISQHRIETAYLKQVAEALDTSRQFKVTVDLRNAEGRRLEPGRPVTIVIEP
jgi:WD40 repeat protein